MSDAGEEPANGAAEVQQEETSGDEEQQQPEEDLRTLAYQTYMPPYLRGPLDPARMQLTEEEKQWAVALKEAAKGLPDLDTLSDMMYAQIALVAEGDLDKAIEKAYMLQAFVQENDILDNFEQGQRLMSRFIRRHPGYILHFFMAEGRYAVATDLCKFDITSLFSPDEKKAMWAGTYYLLHAINPDLEAVRKGGQGVYECQGYLWKAPKMFDLRMFRMAFQDTAALYPLKLHKLSFRNPGVLINTLISMVRPYIPSSIHSTFELGQQSEVRLDTICLVPSLQVAMDRVEREMTESLRRRCEAEKTFTL